MATVWSWVARARKRLTRWRCAQIIWITTRRFRHDHNGVPITVSHRPNVSAMSAEGVNHHVDDRATRRHAWVTLLSPVGCPHVDLHVIRGHAPPGEHASLTMEQPDGHAGSSVRVQRAILRVKRLGLIDLTPLRTFTRPELLAFQAALRSWPRRASDRGESRNFLGAA